MPDFLICTISNKLEQYEEMKSSFVRAGFDEERCRYALFDNSCANAFEPYATISKAVAEATEPYVIFCHQDILLDKGPGFDHLIEQLHALDALDPDWAIAGNAGCSEDLALIIRLDDPNGAHNQGRFPHKVYSLDENFFVIKTASALRCSSSLSGFHLYATDLCLQATSQGLSCYVLDFHLTHLSGGSPESPEFHRALDALKQHWNPSFMLCLTRTPCTFFYLSRSRIIRRLLWSARILGWLRRHIGVYAQAGKLKQRLRRLFRLRRSSPPLHLVQAEQSGV